MVSGKLPSKAMVALIAVLSVQSPSSAQELVPHIASGAATVAERERATNLALLKTLTSRRAQLAQSPVTSESRRDALNFLDARIAQTRRRLGM
jgi:hypothetical protein